MVPGDFYCVFLLWSVHFNIMKYFILVTLLFCIYIVCQERSYLYEHSRFNKVFTWNSPSLASCAICKYIKMCGTCILEYVRLMLYTINFSTDNSKLTIVCSRWADTWGSRSRSHMQSKALNSLVLMQLFIITRHKRTLTIAWLTVMASMKEKSSSKKSV